MRTLFSLRGRISRRTFWIAQLVVIAVFSFLVFSVFRYPHEITLIAILVALWLAIYATTIAIPAKRLHDHDMSGWWTLVIWGPVLMALGPVIYLLITPESSGGAQASIDESNTYVQNFLEGPVEGKILLSYLGVVLTSAIFSIWLIIELWFFRGTDGPNRFGTDTLEK